MLAALRRFLARAPERKGRRLARDARTVAGMVEQTYGPPSLARTAARVAEMLEGSDAVGVDTAAAARWLAHLRSLHTEARRASEQVELSALTLAIIDLEARALGPPGEEARAVVAAFSARGPEGTPSQEP